MTKKDEGSEDGDQARLSANGDGSAVDQGSEDEDEEVEPAEAFDYVEEDDDDDDDNNDDDDNEE